MQAPFRSLDPDRRLQARLLPDLQPPYSTEQHWRPLHHLSIRLLSTRFYLILSSSGQICGQRNSGDVICIDVRLTFRVTPCDIWGFHNGVAEDSSLLGCVRRVADFWKDNHAFIFRSNSQNDNVLQKKTICLTVQAWSWMNETSVTISRHNVTSQKT